MSAVVNSTAVKLSLSHSVDRPLTKLIKTIAEACKVIWIIIKQWCSFSPYEIQELDVNCISPEMQKKLKDFELAFDYPLGDGQRFRIAHGKGNGDYFGFVKRLGSPKFYVAINKKDRQVTRQVEGKPVTVHYKAGEIAGVACGVLRDVGLRDLSQPHSKPIKGWYICDLKVADKYRGDHIPIRLFQKGFWRFFQCSSGYAICMNPGDGSVPRAAHIWQQHGKLPSNTLPLNLYNIKAEDFATWREPIENACKGPVSFKSMQGIKEFDTFHEKDPTQTTPWRILHIQHGPQGEKTLSPSVFADPQPGYDHLIAAVANSELDQALAAIKTISLFSTATIVYRGLNPAIFNNTILTNEI